MRNITNEDCAPAASTKIVEFMQRVLPDIDAKLAAAVDDDYGVGAMKGTLTR